MSVFGRITGKANYSPSLCIFPLCSLCSLWLVLFAPSPASAAGDPTYWQDIRPIFRKHCIACHSTKNLKELDVSGGLALDNYDAVRKGSKQVVVQPGKSSDSLLVKKLLLDDEDKRMPLGATPLPPDKIALIRHWIDTGAKEGQKPDSLSAPVAGTARRPSHKLDIALTTNAVPPKGVLGKSAPAKLELLLKVGPLAPVTAVAFSADGRLLATGSYRQATIWDLATARPVKTLSNVLAAVNDVRFSPDGRLLAVAGGQPSAKGDLRLYQVADWKLLATLGGHDDVAFSVAFSPDGKHLASASFDKTVRIWDLAGHRVERILTGHSDIVYAVAYGPDGKWLVSASKDRSVKLVETATGKSRFTFSGMNQDVLAVAVSSDGTRIVSSGYDTGLYWWNPQTGARVRVQPGHGVAVHELSFSKDGKLVASAGADKTVRLWNGENGAPLKTLTVGAIVYAVSISPDGKLIASGSFDGLTRLWDAATGRQLLTLLAVPQDKVGAGLPRPYEWLALTPEGYTATSAGLTALARWRMAGQTIAPEPVWKVLEHPETVAKAMHGEKLTAPQFGK